MQDTAKDLLNAEEEAVGDENGEGWTKEEGPVLEDEDLSDEKQEGDGLFLVDTEDGGGDKQDRAVTVGFEEPVGDIGAGEDAGMTLNDEVGGCLGGEEGWCVGLGLKTKGTGVEVPEPRVLVENPRTGSSGFLEKTKRQT